MKPQDFVVAHVLPRNVRRREVASSIKQQQDGSSRGAGRRTHARLLKREGQERAARPVSHPETLDLPVPSEATLKAVFDLSTAEARLAQHLARGDSVEEVAQTLSIKMSTARTQLAAIFVKTGTRRQAKLVAILSRLAHLG
jgi:DNA-binding CsgD family transcriptional regulator